ncbi:hypothetical protein SARC_00829 [Sphaeroforma arctica JP610]|uniref:Beta-lactamase n=1 Tax=Sphaeroforma arctica JP610 TaxID=667725 RepID=A0A0L0GDN0_9EUKA|nr:hypothetical protein SARC_00829 [Sphaeroforma arctica JP610]KNC87019.1 hypothetical protein SARC_00829 [Sphaeroforma arctica JP610]|eukprot:XP_014160921.1 hypothetical protein SARC_00829 [Sphaeroforma arctica JP610]
MAYKSKGEDKKPRDLRKAEKFFTKGCDAGDGRSCFNLSTLYLTGGLEDSKGNEIIQDMGKAFELSAKACDLGSKYGCVNAARMVMTTAVEGGDALAEEFQEKANVLHKKV